MSHLIWKQELVKLEAAFLLKHLTFLESCIKKVQNTSTRVMRDIRDVINELTYRTPSKYIYP